MSEKSHTPEEYSKHKINCLEEERDHYRKELKALEQLREDDAKAYAVLHEKCEKLEETVEKQTVFLEEVHEATGKHCNDHAGSATG